MKNWKWLGHKMHLCVSEDCEFGLATVVGGGLYVVATVGDYKNDDGEYESIGDERMFETYVFRAGDVIQECGCPAIDDWGEIDSEGYMNAPDATKGHMAMCKKWDEIGQRPPTEKNYA